MKSALQHVSYVVKDCLLHARSHSSGTTCAVTPCSPLPVHPTSHYQRQAEIFWNCKTHPNNFDPLAARAKLQILCCSASGHSASGKGIFCSGGSRISRRGRRGLPRRLRFENFACQNETIWMLRGACAGHASYRSANALP